MDPNVPTYNPDGGGYYDPNEQAAYDMGGGGYDYGGGDGVVYDYGGGGMGPDASSAFQPSSPNTGGQYGNSYGAEAAEQGYYPTSPQAAGGGGQYDPTMQDVYDPNAAAAAGYVDQSEVPAGAGGTYFPSGQFQPFVQSGPISAVAFDPTTSALYAASHTVSLGRRPLHVGGGGGGVTHGACVAVHNISDGSLYSANSAHPEAEASVLEAISSAVYGSRANVGDVDEGGGMITSTSRRPPPHAYRPPYSSTIDDTFDSSFSVRSSHGMGIGAALPFSSGDIMGDASYAATVSPSSVRVQTNGCACISAAHHVTGMVCGTFNPNPATSYDATSIPTHITVGGVATDSSSKGSGAGYNMHCLDLYADLRSVSSHSVVADSEINHCVTCISPNNVMSTLAAGCSDGTLRVFDGKWRKRGNKEVAKVKGHGGGVVSVDISEDGNLICTTGYSARSSFSSTTGTQIPYAFPDQHVLVYDVRYLGRGGIAHSFTGERGGPRYAAFIPGDEKNRVLVASGQSGGGLQIVTPYDDLQGTGFAEYIQPELSQGEKITALSVHGRDMVLGTSQSNIMLFKMSDVSPTIPSAHELPNSDERAPVIPPDFVPPPPKVNIEPNILRVGAEDSTAMFVNAYMLNVKPIVSSLESDGHVKPFGPLSTNPLVPQSRRLLSDKLLDLVKKQNTGDFIVSVNTSDLDVDLLAAEKDVKKTVSNGETVDVNIPNPNRVVFSDKVSAACYRVVAETQKRSARGSSDDTKDDEDSIPVRYRLTIRPPSSIMLPSDYIRHNNTGVWPGWDYPPSLPNAWASAILMLLYFVPEIRSAVLQAQQDKRLFAPVTSTAGKKGKVTEPGPAVSAELAYIFHQIEMLSSHALIYPRIDGAPDEPQVRAFSPANLITLLSTLPEANQLQILDGGAVSMETARRPEAFYRFLVHHLDNELSAQKAAAGGHKSPSAKLIDSKQGLNYQSINEFVDVSATPTMSSTRTLTVELSYEPFVGRTKKQNASGGSARFSDVLRYSLCKESRLRAWCKASNDYETVVQRKIATSLPPVLSIACSCAGDKNNEGIPVWKNGDDPSRHWLPEVIEVELEDDGNVIVRERVSSDEDGGDGEWEVATGNALPKGVVDILQKSERWTTPSGERKIRYQLEAVVSYVRSIGETDNDSEKGHHIVHVRVPKAYDETALLKQIEELSIHAEDSSERELMTLSSSISDETLEERSRKAAEKLKGLTEKDTDDSWLLVNGLLCNKTVVEDAQGFNVEFKEPCLVTYRQIETSDDEDEKYKLESSQFDIPLTVMNTPSISTGLPPAFFVQNSSDLPGKGDLIAFDAEFVSVQHEDYFLTATGSKVVLREGRNALARMSIIDCRTGNTIIDDHVLPREPVVDYLTRFSGILEEHLNPETSQLHLITARNAYLKLRLLLERGCIFVGHGLNQDFSTVNIFVPPSQIIDTVEIFHLPRMRYISLRFLVNYLLKRDMQQEIHDSIEDARAAFELYIKALEFKKNGAFDRVLREIYDFGRKTDWKLGVRSE